MISQVGITIVKIVLGGGGGHHNRYNTYRGLLAAQMGLNGQGGRYDRQIRIPSKCYQDERMRNTAERNLHNPYSANPFSTGRFHCGDLLIQTLNAGLIPYGVQPLGNKPDQLFDNIVQANTRPQ